MPFREDGVDVHLDDSGNPRIVERRFVVEPELAGHRLDHFLVRKIPRLSRTRAQDIIRRTVSISGRPAKPNSRVALGDVVLMRRDAQPEPPCPRTFTVLHADDQVMVIDKPAGLPVHISARYYFNTLTRVVSERFPDQAWQICHRLDRETSGALVLANGRVAARAVKRAFEKKKIRKTYLAIAHGQVAEDPFVIDRPLGPTRDPEAPIKLRMVVRDDPDALPAVTEVERLALVGRVDGSDAERFSLVACRPISGRQHQIRVHLAEVGHPVVGDKLYAHGDRMFAAGCDQRLTDADREQLLLTRHALHAHKIEVPHPDGSRLVVRCSLPTELREFLADRIAADSWLRPHLANDPRTDHAADCADPALLLPEDRER